MWMKSCYWLKKELLGGGRAIAVLQVYPVTREELDEELDAWIIVLAWGDLHVYV